MYHRTQDEICIAQGPKATTILPSSVIITDPATGIDYKLEFYTEGPTGTPDAIVLKFE